MNEGQYLLVVDLTTQSSVERCIRTRTNLFKTRYADYVKIFEQLAVLLIDWKWSMYQTTYGSDLFPDWVPFIKTYSADYLTDNLERGRIERHDITLVELFESWYQEFKGYRDYFGPNYDPQIYYVQLEATIGRFVEKMNKPEYYDFGYDNYTQCIEYTESSNPLTKEQYNYNPNELHQVTTMDIDQIGLFKAMLNGYIRFRTKRPDIIIDK